MAGAGGALLRRGGEMAVTTHEDLIIFEERHCAGGSVETAVWLLHLMFFATAPALLPFLPHSRVEQGFVALAQWARDATMVRNNARILPYCHLELDQAQYLKI
jgi:hypothetical protein